MDSKQWGMMHSNIMSGLNSYPDALAMTSDNDLVNFSQPDICNESPACCSSRAVGCIIPVYHFLGFSSPYDKEEMVRNMINRYRNDLNFVMVVLFYKKYK